MSIYKLVARLKLSIAIEQRGQFFAELFLALGQALRQHDWHIVEDLISRWQATTEVMAVPELASALTEPLKVGEWKDWDDVQAALFGQTA